MCCDLRRFILLAVATTLIYMSEPSAAKNCADPPKSVAPKECCDFPKFFKENAFDICKENRNRGDQCLYNCVYEVTEICRHGQCDFRKAEDYIDWASPNRDDVFNDVYKLAFKECINEVTTIDKELEQLKRNNCDPKPELVNICVENKMFSLCPSAHFKWNKSECTQNREFLENCVQDA